mgnify:CR=1 FL=1
MSERSDPIIGGWRFVVCQTCGWRFNSGRRHNLPGLRYARIARDQAWERHRTACPGSPRETP